MTLQERLKLIAERGFDFDGTYITRKDSPDAWININELAQISNSDFYQWLSGFEIVKRKKTSWSKKEMFTIIRNVLESKNCTITDEELNKIIF